MANRSGLPQTRKSSRRGPSRDLIRMQRNLDRMFDEFLTPFQVDREGWWGGVANQPFEFVPACDIEEAINQYRVSFDLPGLSKEDIKIEIRNHQLIVSGERKHEEEKEVGRQLSVERSYGFFQRIFDLPSSINAEAIEANYENGVLQIVVPKAEEAQVKAIPIKEHKGGFFGKLLGGHKEEVPVQEAEETEAPSVREKEVQESEKKEPGHAA